MLRNRSGGKGSRGSSGRGRRGSSGGNGSGIGSGSGGKGKGDGGIGSGSAGIVRRVFAPVVDNKLAIVSSSGTLNPARGHAGPREREGRTKRRSFGTEWPLKSGLRRQASLNAPPTSRATSAFTLLQR